MNEDRSILASAVNKRAWLKILITFSNEKDTSDLAKYNQFRIPSVDIQNLMRNLLHLHYLLIDESENATVAGNDTLV